jgi:hypothetical protein
LGKQSLILMVLSVDDMLGMLDYQERFGIEFVCADAEWEIDFCCQVGFGEF